MATIGTVKRKKIIPEVAKATRRALIAFYETHQEYLPPLTFNDELILWELIFQHFFGEMPVHDTTKTVPSYYRPGSTDPRWDDLFFRQYALTIHRRLLLQHARTGLLTRTVLEAA